jgi:hypothetical protein
VDDEEPLGVDNTYLETYVDQLEAELDQEIADLDTDYEGITDPDSNHEQTEMTQAPMKTMPAHPYPDSVGIEC